MSVPDRAAFLSELLVHHTEKMSLRRLAIAALILLSLVQQSRQVRTRSGRATVPDILDQTIGSLNPNAIAFVPKRREKARFKPRKTRTQRKEEKRERGCWRPREKAIKIYSQNVHGLFESAKAENGKAIKGERTCVKREYIVDMMKRMEIDIFLMQETWDEGDSAKDHVDLVLRHYNNKN